MFDNEIEEIKNKYDKISNNLNKHKNNLNILKGKIEEINRQINKEINDRDKAQDDQLLYQKTSIFCTSLLDKTNTSIEEMFSNIGSAALTKIFGDDKKLKFSFDQKKKKNPSINIQVSQPWDNGEELITNIVDAEGGAMIDIVALGLRLAMIKLITPEQKGPIFLDEICRYISKNESVKSTGEFLKEISSILDKQLIIITHTPELMQYADKLFILEIGPNKSVIIKEQIQNEDQKNEQD